MKCEFNKYFLLFGLLTLLATACEKEFEIRSTAKSGCLYVECFPSNDTDTTFVRISGTAPISKKAVAKSLEGLTVRLETGGHEAVLDIFSATERSVVLYSLAHLSVGDELNLEADANNYPRVTSSSSVPKPPVFGMDRNGNVFRFSFDRSKDGKKRYYGIKASCLVTITQTSASTGELISYDESTIEAPLNVAEESIPENDDIFGYETIVTATVNGSEMIVFEDEGADADKFELTVIPEFPSDRQSQWGGVVTTRKCYVRFSVYSVTKEAYEYLNPRVDYSLISLGLVSPFISFGNIKDGYGILSAMGRYDTDLLPNEDYIP